MKNRLRFLLYLFLITVLPGLVNGCKKIEDGLSSIIWQINFDLISTTWDIQFIDAATGVPVGADSDDRVDVVISGKDKDQVLDLAGIRQSTFHSTKGALALALHPDRLSPETLTPVRFFVHAHHPDYLPVTVPVLTHQAGINPLKIYLINRNEPPVNVDLITRTASGLLVDGRLADPLNISTPANLASVRMEAGTEVLSANGARLSGNLKLTMSFSEGGTTSGLKTLPGGQLAVNGAGNPGLIYLAGGIYLEIMDADGKYAGTLSQPMECQVSINPSVYDPFTKTRLTAGATIPVWCLNPGSGVWESRGTTNLRAEQNKLSAVFSMNAPGMYLIGWINGNLCPTPLIMHPNTLPEYNEIPYAFTLNIFEVFGEELRFVRTTGISGQVTDDYSLRFLPDNSELVFRFDQYIAEDKPYYKNPDPILLSGFCQSGNPLEFDLLPKPNSTYKKIEVVFIDVEHNNTRYNPKVFPGYYRKSGSATWQSAFVFNGHAYIINPQQGDQYEMGINFKGEFHLKDVTIGPEEVVLVEIAID